MPPTSPCQNECCLDEETGRCITCNRTREDIIEWGSMTEEERKERMKELQQE